MAKPESLTGAQRSGNKTATPIGLAEDQIDRILQGMADSLGQLLRSPVLHKPSEENLVYEDITFPAVDGVPLEGWFIPAKGSDKLIIVNHPMGFSRSGTPTHLQPWKAVWESSGNGFEVNLVPDIKILHDAGYSVLAYDLRNHGLSSTANGGAITNGLLDSRDVLGSLKYARGRSDTRDMAIGLFSRCTGCNATFSAMSIDPKEFEGVRCLVACQPVTTKTILQRRMALAGVPSDRIDELDNRIRLKTSFGFAERAPIEWAKAVRVPTYVYGVHDDILTTPDDLQAMFENMPVSDKKIQWIGGSTARWDGYLEFQRRPQPMLDWFKQHM